MNAREAAYLAIWQFFKNGRFASDTLSEWQHAEDPPPRDFNLSQEISYGTIRMSQTLDFLAKHLADQKKLPGKLKEKALVRMALYQFYYMDQVPLYAIADEAIKIARRYCHESFTGYLNAILRKLEKTPLMLPKGDSVEALSMRLSYPNFFVDALVQDYGLAEAKEILELGNRPPVAMARLRDKPGNPVIIDPEQIGDIAKNPSYYIQNATPAFLISSLCEQGLAPGRILDLCASPGGKLIALHDHFPEAELYANDVNAEKVRRLRENLCKYQIEAFLSCCKGEEYPDGDRFDLIVLDVPCSNSGVLNKRPEARWRLSKESLHDLERTQLALLRNAHSLLEPEGEIWYMTCSLLKSENEILIEKACAEMGMKVKYQKTVLPNREGWDGGFAAALQL